LDHLDKAVPDWETINKDPAFLKWLGEMDPLTGIQRQELLNQAHKALDAPRVANFFNSWKGGRHGYNSPGPHQKTTITREQFS